MSVCVESDVLLPTEIHLIFVKACKATASSTVKECTAQFKPGRTCLEIDPREGRQKMVIHYPVSKQYDSGLSTFNGV